jgi:alanine-synthesizing transaminase
VYVVKGLCFIVPQPLQEAKMPFSQRTNWNTEENDLSRAHRARIAAGLPLYDLTAANPTRCGLNYPPQLLDALTDPSSLHYDPQPRGLLRSRQAVCNYYQDHNVHVEPEQIVLTTSTSEAYSFLFRLLCDPGAEILVPQPGYPLFDYLATLEDLRISAVPLLYDQGWQIDPESFRRALTPRTRAIMLVHPNNPTGHFTQPWEADELAQICREHHLALIVDEVFLDFSFGQPAQSFAAGLEGVDVYVVSGLSKIAGLPQMKAAWIATTGPNRGEALDRLEIIADTFLSMNAPIQSALPAWIEGRGMVQDQIRTRTLTNLAELDRQLASLPAVERLRADGGWYAILRIPALEPDEQTVRSLLDRGLWVQPGYFFGLRNSGWLILSLLTPVDEFATGIEVLVDSFRTNPGGNITEIQLKASL